MTSTPINHARFWTDEHEEVRPFNVIRASQTVPHTLYFDLEVRRGPDEFGGDWERVRKEGGVSVLCIWDEREDRPYFYDDHTLAEAAERLSSAELVVSFNGAWFDVPLIENHLMRNLQLNEHVDLFALVKHGLDRVGKSFRGHGLDALAQSTLGHGKNGSASRAPELARMGHWAELTNYCLEDVLLTRDLGHFIAREGFVYDKDGERLLLSVPPWYVSPAPPAQVANSTP
jgi:DEAD/DEAH box helicase domain-containing protein